jgi:hypothetical protein
VVTYTVLVKVVAQTDNMYAGAKIMALYREMRGRFGIHPDLQLAYALVNSFVRARSRVGGLEMEDLEEVFADLRQLGWRADTLARLERRAASFLLGLYSEAWKETEGGRQGRQGRQRAPTTAEKLFEKYNWNRKRSRVSRANTYTGSPSRLKVSAFCTMSSTSSLNSCSRRYSDARTLRCWFVKWMGEWSVWMSVGQQPQPRPAKQRHPVTHPPG